MSAFSKASFLASAAKPADIPPQAGPELAFFGRSNVGKSSAINALAGRRRLAFVSRTPGRTRTINFYSLGDAARLADLPGYGYASAPRSVRAGWDPLLGAYLASRRLAAAVVLMDARRPLTGADQAFLAWLAPVEAPLLVLLSKSDKLARAALAETLQATRRLLAKAGFAAHTMGFSCKDRDSVDAVRAYLEARVAEASRGNKKPPAS